MLHIYDAKTNTVIFFGTVILQANTRVTVRTKRKHLSCRGL